MYARMASYECGTNEVYDRGLEMLKSELAPKVRAMQGFVGLLNLVDRSNATGLTITLWDSEESLASSREATKSMRNQAADAVGWTIASVEEYEVGIAELQ